MGLAKSTAAGDTSTTAAGDGSTAGKTPNPNKGMDFFLVLFHADNKNKKKISNPPHQIIKRTNSSSLILTKAQSTISICALLVFVTLLLFTLSTFEPNQQHLYNQNKLQSKPHSQSNKNSWFSSKISKNPNQIRSQRTKLYSSIALQRMGTLFRRGTRAMSELVVCRVTEDVNEEELRLFVRVLHRSGLTTKADLVFLFESSSTLSRFKSVVETENESFVKLVEFYKNGNNSASQNSKSVLGFDLNQFMRSMKKGISEPLWGKKIKLNSSYTDSVSDGRENELTRLSYGSVVGFEANELDPENSLAGFMDHVPMSLRQWACYPMLLGRVRRNFKHIMLVDVKNLVVLGDPLGRVKIPRPESVYVSIKQQPEVKHHRKNSDKTHLVNTAILMGGSRGIRRLSDAMLNEIVRATMAQHKKKNSVTESGILGQLVSNEHLLKNINLVKSTESVVGTSSLAELAAYVDPSIMKRGNNSISNLYFTVMKQICSFEVDSSVYRDC